MYRLNLASRSFLVLLLLISSCSSNEPTDTQPSFPIDPSTEQLQIERIESIDELMIAFMEDFNVPGASLAIAKDGQLAYAKGYGYASVESKDTVNTSHKFRVASLSKPITAFATFQLIEEDLIELDQRVFGEESILGTDYGTSPYKPGIEEITVRHLLQHTAGGWTNNAQDPMFQHTHLNHQQLISKTIAEVPLNSSPGATYQYSNFGYCILGRIIEKVSGMTYYDYVKENILIPSNAIMDIARPGVARNSNEVTYYSQGGDPYTINVKRMDSHGGWVSSALDFLKMTVRMDGFTSVPDLITINSVNSMLQPSSVNQNYASGWAVNQHNNKWHTGGLPGTSAIVVRTSRDLSWVILLNSTQFGTDYYTKLDQLGWQIVNSVTFTKLYDLLK